jgi:hypothetical protein
MAMEFNVLKRELPKGNHAVSYCCEAASQIKPEEMPAELPFGAPEATLKRALPDGNHAVSYCCEAASQIRPEEMPAELPFG